MSSVPDLLPRPKVLPKNPRFCSGPTTKRPGWNPQVFESACLGRSHRSAVGAARLSHCVGLMRDLLGIPKDYQLGIVPASDTGAMEMALWSLLGVRGVDIFAWEAFGKLWLSDLAEQLRLDDVRVFSTDYGDLPDLHQYDNSRDCVLAWNGTTSGVIVPNADWISDEREGLVIADATSAVFAVPLPFEKIDVATFSWQKALGGEAGHGVIVLSPRALSRLESHTPSWPVPRIFSLVRNGVLDRGVFEGQTINTPSMLCVEDAIDALEWVHSAGGRLEMFKRVEENFSIIRDWVRQSDEVDFFASDEKTISPISVTLQIKSGWFTCEDEASQRRLLGAITSRLEDAGAAFDINGYRNAPPCLRIWCGPMVEASDLLALLPWLEWALVEVAHEHLAKH